MRIISAFRPAAIAAFAISAALLSPTFAHDAPHVAPADAEAVAATLNNQMLALLRNYQRAAGDDKARVAQQMMALFEKRQDHLYALVERNPRLVLLMQLPGELRRQLPAAVAAKVEQEVDATGIVLGRVGDDFARGRASHHFFLELPVNGVTQRLSINGADATLSSDEMLKLVGSRVTIRGLLLKDHIVVSERSKVKVLAAAGDGSSGGTTTGTTGGTTTLAASVDETTLVIMGNFSDKALTCTGADISNRLFSADPAVQSMNRLYAETSRQQVTFSGQVVGPFNIPYSSTGTCDYAGWGNALKAAAQAAGVSLANFRRVSYAVPPNGSCGWSGLAYLGGSFPTQSWVASCGHTGVFVHEIGHNMRFHHAATPTAEYGDGSDPMGGVRMVQLNAPNRVAAGWLPPGNVVDANGSGSYTLTSLSLTSAFAPQVLRLRKADTNEYYYVSLRSATGFDKNLPAFNGTSGYAGAVSVHRSPGALGAKTYVLAQLSTGQTYTDATNGITISPTSISGEGATIAVTTSAPVCSTSAPTIAVTPVSQYGAPGSTRQYGMTVTSRNSASCPSSTISMASAVPSGFASSFSPASVTLAPGASASITWSVASSAAAPLGTYPIRAIASDSAAAGSAQAADASYVVYTDSTGPTVSLQSPANGAVLNRGRITLSASASDPDGVARVEFFIDGKLLGSDTSAPYSLTWNARKAAPGEYAITARGYDSAGNHSDATASITLR